MPYTKGKKSSKAKEKEKAAAVVVKLPPPPAGKVPAPVVKVPPPVIKAPTPDVKAPTPVAKTMNGYGDESKPASRTALISYQAVSRSIFPFLVSPAAERIRFILGEDDDGPAPPQLFTELDELLWIKFEEKVEKGGERWSKPHVATLSLHSLFELRTCIEKGTIMLDLEASTLPQVVGGYHCWQMQNQLPEFIISEHCWGRRGKGRGKGRGDVRCDWPNRKPSEVLRTGIMIVLAGFTPGATAVI
ncbi:hypothetical protein JZ751_001852 [Albula glossodonta]|uniref:Band 3 cytoplasmic domain-containing protein n=1 Tax=Albula glossodonta TaxID=121402 RepID=A0A8T2PUW1_9TELE|nr:hypothetical protein JZ751_001852 [Albula glossodonta]